MRPSLRALLEQLRAAVRPTPSGRATPAGLTYFNERLEKIAAPHRVWRLRGESDPDLAARAAVAVCERILELEDDLRFLLNINRR